MDPSLSVKQIQEIDAYIGLQNMTLTYVVQEQQNQQLLSLIRRVESIAAALLQEKEEDLIKARKQTTELEDCLKRAEMENTRWQQIALESEAKVLALSNTLEEVRRASVVFRSSSLGDAESCCGSSSHAFDPLSQREERAEIEEKMICSACNSQSSSVLLLPCRHLCSCKSCEAFLDLCPVCKSAKKGSIEVYMT